MSYTTNKSYHVGSAGFTLIELMISLVLGLLISAAVIQVYIINMRTATVQQSASEVQDSSIFAMQAIEDNVRIANLGNPITSINSTTKNGGIVLTTTNLGSANTTEAKFLTTNNTGLSNINNIASDQLTIQYKNITQNSLFDCEGTEVLASSNDWVVERYFIRATDSSSTTGVRSLSLACDAGRIDNTGVVTTPFSGNGQIIVEAVDQFKILLGIQTDAKNLTYITVDAYLQLSDKPPITTIKTGVIIRSNTPLANETDKSTFVVLGTEQTLKTDTTRANYYRRSYESTVLLRNARVINFTASAAPAA
ncbi:PilW family protein [Psychrobacter piscatorii]|uniref:PilW family protein n=1 Tax=Psychrobacter piscatorii TaxID=554343 RepID=UPI001D10F0B5|nr:PilW family protein [Psychrobacter piscatorii]